MVKIVPGSPPPGIVADPSVGAPGAPAAEAPPTVVKLAEIPATAIGPLDASGIPSSFPIGALQAIPTPSSSGQVFRLDNGFLDALRLQVRRIETAESQPGYSIQFKISGPSRPAMDVRMTQKGAEALTFEFAGAEAVEKDGQVVLKEGSAKTALSASFSGSHKMPDTKPNPHLGLRLKGNNWEVDYMPHDGPAAVRGVMRIRVIGDDATCNQALQQVITQIGLQPAFAPPTEASIRRFALMKLLWRTEPSKAAELIGDKDLSGIKSEQIKAALAELGVDESRMDGLRYAEVAPGHFAVLDDRTVEEMKAAGLRYAYSTVATEEHVLSILKHGQKATATRWAEGLLVTGMSSMTDVGTGGAQGVFSRLVPDTANGKTWSGRKYKIILRPELLARTDIWGWPGDFYGRAWQLTPKNFGVKLLEDVKQGGSGFASSNEIISPFGNGPQWIGAVVATSEADRTTLINYLKSAGYEPPTGESLEQFVRFANTIPSDLLGG